MMANDIHGTSRVLKASDVRLRRDDPHATPVAQRIAEAERNAFRAGYEDGFTAGALQAGAELAAAAEQLRHDVTDALAAHAAGSRAARAADALRVVEHALAIAEWAVRRELTSVPDAFFARLAELLADRDRNEAVEIATAASLAEPTRRWLSTDGGFGPDDAVRVVAAEDLAGGEARVNIGDTTIFATFADTFGRARAALGVGPDGPTYDELLGPAASASDEQRTGADGGQAEVGTAPPAAASGEQVTEHDEELVEVLYDMTLPSAGPGADRTAGR